MNKIKYYLITMLLALGGYVWAMTEGIKITGDDKQQTEERSLNGGRNFYHK